MHPLSYRSSGPFEFALIWLPDWFWHGSEVCPLCWLECLVKDGIIEPHATSCTQSACCSNDSVGQYSLMILPLLLLHQFNGFFSGTILVSRYQKGKTSLHWGKRCWGFGMPWHQLDHMQTICTSLQTDNHTNTSSLNFYRPSALPGTANSVKALKAW